MPEPTLILIRQNINYDWFCFAGTDPYYLNIVEDIIEQCDLKESRPGSGALQRLTNDQVMMLKLCCPVPLKIMYYY
jgi:hypothetical protein